MSFIKKRLEARKEKKKQEIDEKINEKSNSLIAQRKATLNQLLSQQAVQQAIEESCTAKLHARQYNSKAEEQRLRQQREQAIRKKLKLQKPITSAEFELRSVTQVVAKGNANDERKNLMDILRLQQEKAKLDGRQDYDKVAGEFTDFVDDGADEISAIQKVYDIANEPTVFTVDDEDEEINRQVQEEIDALDAPHDFASNYAAPNVPNSKVKSVIELGTTHKEDEEDAFDGTVSSTGTMRRRHKGDGDDTNTPLMYANGGKMNGKTNGKSSLTSMFHDDQDEIAQATESLLL